MNEDKKDNSPIIEWEIKHKDEVDRSDYFYYVILGIMILLLGFSIWQKNLLFGIFVILATGMILFLSEQHPETYRFQLTDKELIIGNNEIEYEYKKFSHFDIYEYHESENELLLVFKEKLKPLLKIRLYRGDVEKIKEFMKTKLPQKTTEPSLLDFLSKIVGI